MPVADEESWMRLALRLAARGRGTTSPNPMVGCVLVRDGVEVGAGWHRRAGEPHAEVLALRASGDRSVGSTAFVTLEPCAHHGRTPPCAEALTAAGVRRVVVAMEDPDPRTAGKGIHALREAGIEVEVGLLEVRARRLNEQYILHRTAGRPFVTYKAGVSLDGRTAAADGSSQWITSEESRRDAHRLRARSDAICAGIGTVLSDDPQLTVRGIRSGRGPLRVVVDSNARTPIRAKVLGVRAATAGAAANRRVAAPEDPGSRLGVPATIFTAGADAGPGVAALGEAGVEVVAAPGADGRVSLPGMLRVLGERGIVSLLLEGGATLAGSFSAEGLIDRYVFYLAPKLLGDSPAGALGGWAAATINAGRNLEIREVKRIGPDLRVTAYPLKEVG